MGAGNGRQRLLEGHDDLAFGMPFAEIPKRFGHLIQPVAAVNDRGDLSRLDELNDGRQALRTLPDGQEPYLFALGPSDHRPDQQDLQERSHRPADIQIASPGHERALIGKCRTVCGHIKDQVVGAPISGEVVPRVVDDVIRTQ
jgi:hypothetical protein